MDNLFCLAGVLLKKKMIINNDRINYNIYDGSKWRVVM